jgi:bifunctional DNA-binding transcriptional regulator/antitoxin component of YhaV-PrlF toxin-antitoxin module
VKTIIDDAGRIQLPDVVQAQLGVKPGDEVLLENRNGEWAIKPVQAEPGLRWKGNVLVHEGVCSQPIDRVLAELREGRLEHLSEGSAS